MTNRTSRWLCFSLIILLAAPASRPAFAASPNVVISQVYGGGGNAGATYRNDFIELFNRGASPGAVVTNLTGPLDYTFRSYTILPDPGTPPSVNGLHSAIPVPLPAAGEFTVGFFNVERFFDTVNDPTKDDVALTADAFARRLNKASLAIRDVLRSPDILGVEEMEILTALEALASKVNADAVAAGGPDPGYAAYLVEGNDIGGIDSGFLVKGSRVTVVEVTQYGEDTVFVAPDGSRRC